VFAYCLPGSNTLAYFFRNVRNEEKKVFQIFHQIPAFLRECRDHSAAPMDGQTLSDTLHNRGINIRYLGIVANLVLDFFWPDELAYRPTSVHLNLWSF
jgi:Translation initiation factor eIF3 subunit 135